MLVASQEQQLPVREARDGHPEAWEALLARYRLPLYAYVFELVPHEQTSLDIVQETFIAAARHIGRLQQDEKFGSWLFSIAHQKCVQLWRRGRKDEVSIDPQDEQLPGLDPAPDELLIRKEQEEGFMKLLEKLSAPHRSGLLLHFMEDFSFEEIAQITGNQIGTVKSRLHYARKTLRKLLAERKI